MFPEEEILANSFFPLTSLTYFWGLFIFAGNYSMAACSVQLMLPIFWFFEQRPVSTKFFCVPLKHCSNTNKIIDIIGADKNDFLFKKSLSIVLLDSTSITHDNKKGSLKQQTQRWTIFRGSQQIVNCFRNPPLVLNRTRQISTDLN